MYHRGHRGLKHTALSFFSFSFFFINILWRTAGCAPIQDSCVWFNNTKRLTNLLRLEAHEELTNYVQSHFKGNVFSPVGDDAPDSTISGVTTHEKLQDIYSKSLLFQFHLERVEEYERTLWRSTPASSLLTLKERLSHIFSTIEILLQLLDPERSLPPKPAPLQLSHSRDIKKKEYGRSVLVRLDEWIRGVHRLLEEINLCKSRDSGF